MIAAYNLFNIIAIVIIFNILHSDFKIITTSMLEASNKIIEKIQNII